MECFMLRYGNFSGRMRKILINLTGNGKFSLGITALFHQKVYWSNATVFISIFVKCVTEL